jgi:hypothetical protein
MTKMRVTDGGSWFHASTWPVTSVVNASGPPGPKSSPSGVLWERKSVLTSGCRANQLTSCGFQAAHSEKYGSGMALATVLSGQLFRVIA